MKVLLLILMVMMTACTHKTPELDLATPSGSLPQLDRVVFIDKNLQQTTITKLFGITLKNKVSYQISVVNTGSSVGETGFMKAWALFQNHTDQPLTLEIRAVFINDSDSIGENGSTAWQPLFLTSKGVKNYEGLSGFPHASHYIIEVREL